MRLLFLDMDGVINSENAYRRREEEFSGVNWWEIYSKPLVNRVNKFACDFNFDIIISSSWRKQYENLDQIKEAMKRIGLLHERVKGSTGVLGYRGDEIRSYVATNMEKEIEYVVVIDDIIEADPGGLFGIPYFMCKTEWANGFDKKSDTMARKWIKKLNGRN